jgi:hypothetical protein
VYLQQVQARRTMVRCLLWSRCLPGFRAGCPAGLQRLRRQLDRLPRGLRHCAGRPRLPRRSVLAAVPKGPSPGEALHPAEERPRPGADPSRHQSTSSHRQHCCRDRPGLKEPGPKRPGPKGRREWLPQRVLARRLKRPPQPGPRGRQERLPSVQSKHAEPTGLPERQLPAEPGKGGLLVEAQPGTHWRQRHAERCPLRGVRPLMRQYARRRRRPQRFPEWTPGLSPLMRGMLWPLRLARTTARGPVPRQRPLTSPGRAG